MDRTLTPNLHHLLWSMCYWLQRGPYTCPNGAAVRECIECGICPKRQSITHLLHVTTRLVARSCTQKMNKVMKFLHVHLRTWSSSNVKCRGISYNISLLSGQYGKLWTALGERGSISGMNAIAWHVIKWLCVKFLGIQAHVFSATDCLTIHDYRYTSNYHGKGITSTAWWSNILLFVRLASTYITCTGWVGTVGGDCDEVKYWWKWHISSSLPALKGFSMVLNCVVTRRLLRTKILPVASTFTRVFYLEWPVWSLLV